MFEVICAGVILGIFANPMAWILAKLVIADLITAKESSKSGVPMYNPIAIGEFFNKLDELDEL